MSASASPVLSSSQLERLGALGEERTSQLGDVLYPVRDRTYPFIALTGSAAGTKDLLETSVPGIFAAGDVRSGSTKRCAMVVGEGAMAVRFVHRRLAELAHAPP